MGVLKHLLVGSSFLVQKQLTHAEQVLLVQKTVRESKYLYVCTATIGLAAFILDSDKVEINN